jgi:hypothetical protein
VGRHATHELISEIRLETAQIFNRCVRNKIIMIRNEKRLALILVFLLELTVLGTYGFSAVVDLNQQLNCLVTDEGILKEHECRARGAGETFISITCNDGRGVEACRGTCVPIYQSNFMVPIIPTRAVNRIASTRGTGPATMVVTGVTATVLKIAERWYQSGGFRCESPANGLSCDPPKGQEFKECTPTYMITDICDTRTTETIQCGPLKQVLCSQRAKDPLCTSSGEECDNDFNFGNAVGTCSPIKQECK